MKCLDCEEKGCRCSSCRPSGNGYSCASLRTWYVHVTSKFSCIPVRLWVILCSSVTVLEIVTSFSLVSYPPRAKNVVVLLTRDVCVNRSKLEEMNWNPDEWLPLIKDGEFRDWLVKRPAEKDLLRARRVTRDQIVKLEDIWKTDAKAKLEDLGKNGKEDSVTHILPCYEDGFQYQNIFGPLVKMEADEDKMMKENQTQEGLSLERWDRSLKKNHVAVFRPSSSDGGEVRIVPGVIHILSADSLVVSLPLKAKVYKIHSVRNIGTRCVHELDVATVPRNI